MNSPTASPTVWASTQKDDSRSRDQLDFAWRVTAHALGVGDLALAQARFHDSLHFEEILNCPCLYFGLDLLLIID